MHHKRFIKTQGFTLIELLVVMAVLSILVGVGINTFSIAQKKARDSKRKADVRQLQIALEAFKLNVGQYPNSGSPVTWINAHELPTYDTRFTTSYLPAIPRDPLVSQSAGCFDWATATSVNTCYSYAYYSCSSGTGYLLGIHLEDAGDPQRGKGTYCNLGGTFSTTEYGNPGTAGITSHPQWYFVTGQ